MKFSWRKIHLRKLYGENPIKKENPKDRSSLSFKFSGVMLSLSTGLDRHVVKMPFCFLKFF